MQTKTIVGFSVLALMAFFCVGAISRLGASGRLEISPEFDVGELTHGQELSLAIGFRNGGTGVLRLSPPIPGCNCAPAEIDKEEYAPGETGVFRVTLRPVQAPGMPSAQSIIVPSNDPSSPRTMVTVRGRMRDALVSRPNAIRLNDVKPGEEWKRQITVHSSDTKTKFRVVWAESDHPGLIVAIIQAADPPTLEVTPAGILPAGRATGRITVHTDHPKLEKLEIPVEAVVESNLSIEPAQLLFDASSSTKSQRVTISAEAPITLSQSGEKDELLRVRVQSDESGRQWTVDLELLESGLPNGTTRFTVELPVHGLEFEDHVAIPVTVIASGSGQVAGVKSP